MDLIKDIFGMPVVRFACSAQHGEKRFSPLELAEPDSIHPFAIVQIGY